MATNSKLTGAFVMRKRITSNYRFRIVGSKPWLPSVYLYLSIFHFVVNEKHRFYLVFWHSDISKHLILNIFFSRSLFMFWQLESGILTCKLQADTSQIRWNMLNKSPLEKIQRFFYSIDLFFFDSKKLSLGSTPITASKWRYHLDTSKAKLLRYFSIKVKAFQAADNFHFHPAGFSRVDIYYHLPYNWHVRHTCKIIN